MNMTDTPMDYLQWIAVVALPFWIASIVALIRFILEHHERLGRWGFPLYMGFCVPIALIGVAVPTAALMRYIDRDREYDSCVVHENANDPMNGCPGWTVQALERLA